VSNYANKLIRIEQLKDRSTCSNWTASGIVSFLSPPFPFSNPAISQSSSRSLRQFNLCTSPELL